MAGVGPCCCGCTRVGAMHVVATALADDDLDRALEAGLLECVRCDGCSDACWQRLQDARVAREGALAARERFRARGARLERRRKERAERRAVTPSPIARPALPPAAAAALARAKARAAGHREE